MKGKRVVIGITGSIAAYKIPFLIRLLIKEGAEVQVIMTPAAVNFVTPLTLSTLSQKPVIVDPFISGTGQWNNHVELGEWADLMVFAPVTANTLGKMVNGIADNFLITCYLAAKCPIFVAPAMDLDMYKHPSTQRNIEKLKENGNTIIEPQVGELASGLCGIGRMEEPEALFKRISAFLVPRPSACKKKVLITAGPTHEPIDPVRFVGNNSTGKMGFSIAEEIAPIVREVVLISGPTHLNISHGNIRRHNIQTAEEMYAACMTEAPDADIIIMAAAVADYTPVSIATSKIKKGKAELNLQLRPTTDILEHLGKHKRKGQFLVGFALETDNELENAGFKLQKKNLDLVVLNSLNDPGAGFGPSTNKITILDKTGIIHQGVLKEKKDVARDIVKAIFERIKTKNGK